ncbi:hypothetical protein N8D56_00795 [Devosia sp. A8/3-2]|nr:hypothetical protein N8D56_00795 [Devosia sp. A8/3-2]
MKPASASAFCAPRACISSPALIWSAPPAEPRALRQLLVARRKSSPLSAAMKSFIALCSETYSPAV